MNIQKIYTCILMRVKHIGIKITELIVSKYLLIIIELIQKAVEN